MIEIIDCEQGTDEWFAARAGIPTASEFSTILAKGKGGSASITRTKYLYRLLGERITGEIAESYTNSHMMRGNEMEEDAVNLYSMLNEVEAETIGFVRNGEIGCSPDRFVGDNGLLEIKTKLPHLLLPILEKGDVPTEHIPQIQGQMMVCERDWCDFVVYWPKIKPFIKRVYRDDGYTAKLMAEINKFLAELKEKENAYSSI